MRTTIVPILLVAGVMLGAQTEGTTVFNEKVKLQAHGLDPWDLFGAAVSLSDRTALLGAFRDDDKGEDAGAAYVFSRCRGAWLQHSKLVAEDGLPGDHFGAAVAASRRFLLVGSPGADGAEVDSGAVYVFVRRGLTWEPEAKLVADDGSSRDQFGGSVALWGNVAVIGAAADDDNGTNSGSAYVFVRSGSGWTQQAKLLASDGAVTDWFGTSVAISGDDLIVGAYRDDDVGLESGSAYVFSLDGGVWSEAAKLTASDGGENEFFGLSVAISGSRILVGSYRHPHQAPRAGAVYAFGRDRDNWLLDEEILASDGAEGDNFGWAVALAGDVALVGALFADDEAGTSTGGAYLVVREEGGWEELGKFLATDGTRRGFLGHAVALSDREGLVGGVRPASGTAYLFQFRRKLTLEVVPGDENNQIPRGGGTVIPVAILSKGRFDAWEIDPSSIVFGPAEASILHATGHAEDVDGDGDLDLLVHFRKSETGIECGDTRVTLSGRTLSSWLVRGSAPIETTGCPPG